MPVEMLGRIIRSLSNILLPDRFRISLSCAANSPGYCRSSAAFCFTLLSCSFIVRYMAADARGKSQGGSNEGHLEAQATVSKPNHPFFGATGGRDQLPDSIFPISRSFCSGCAGQERIGEYWSSSMLLRRPPTTLIAPSGSAVHVQHAHFGGAGCLRF